MNTIKKFTIIMLILTLIIVSFGCNNNGEETLVEEVDLSEELKTIEAFGLVKSQIKKNVVIDFPATVKEVLVNQGQQLSLGDPIMTLDMSEYITEVSNRENQINISKLEQQKVEKSIKGLNRENRELEIEKLENDLNFAKEVHQQYMDELSAQLRLFEAGAISKHQLDTITRNVEEKRKDVDDIQYKLQEANQNKEREIEQFLLRKGAEGDQLLIQREKTIQEENELTVMKNKLNKQHIKDNQIICDLEKAVIYDIQYIDGDIIDPTLKAFSIASLNDLIVEANVVEDFIKDVQIGAIVRISPITDRGREYEGKVTYISNMAFEQNGETVVPVRISVENIDHFLIPNYNVDVFIDIK